MSIESYLGELIAGGYRLTTTSNEADGGTQVVSIPLVKRAERAAIGEELVAALKRRYWSDGNVDWANTLVEWAREHQGEWLRSGIEYPAEKHFDQSSLYGPEADEAPGFWVDGNGATITGKLVAKGGESELSDADLEAAIKGEGAGNAFRVRCSDAPVKGNQRSLILFGGLEADRATLSFVPIQVVET